MTLVVVMAHSGTEEHCRAHLPFWQKQGDVTFFSPSDSVVRVSGFPVWTRGRSGHHSKHANDRFLAMLKNCEATKHDAFVVQEYDSVCFAPVTDIPEDHLAGIAFTDANPARKFVGSQFVHPPLFFSRAVLVRIIAILDGLREDERFMWDRWLGLCCERGGIPVHDLRARGLGYSMNTIGPLELPIAIRAAESGAVCFHGIKSKHVFEAIKKAGRW